MRAASRESPSTSNETSNFTRNKKARTLEEKHFEFELIRANEEDSDDEGGDTLRKDIVMSRSMVTLNDCDSEELIKHKLVSSLNPKYPMLEKYHFEFIKVFQKITFLQMGKNTEYNYSVVKQLAGQGLLYIRMKKALQCIVDEVFQEDSDSFPEIAHPLLPIHLDTLEPEMPTCHTTTHLPEIPAVQQVHQQCQHSNHLLFFRQ